MVDGFPMAKKSKGATALSAAITTSAIKGHVEVNGKKAYYVLGKPYDN
jgi:TctA family transporter